MSNKKDELHEKFNAFVDSLENKTLEELEALEKEVIAEADVLDKKIPEIEIALPKDGMKEAKAAIQRLLNKQTISWQYALGTLALYDEWDPSKKGTTVKYPALDATLTTLGDMQFTGASEWKDVILVNNYFEPIRDEYVKTRNDIYFIAGKHNAVMQKMELLKPINGDTALEESEE